VEDVKTKAEDNPVLYFKQQEKDNENIPNNTKIDICLIIMTQFQSEMF